LQQGIVQCITLNNPACEVFRLQQRDASLQGAAMLAAGTMQARQQDAERILFINENKALPEKYVRWKRWLDALLEA
jgi:glycerol kinase